MREDTVSGRMANAFMAGRAAQLGVEMGPTTALNVSMALMRADYEYRVNQHHGSELGYDKIQQYHENVFKRFQLDRDAWTATAILDVFGKEFEARGFSSETGKEFAWSLMMQSGYLGSGAVANGGITAMMMGFASPLLSNGQPNPNFDPRAAKWLGDVTVAGVANGAYVFDPILPDRLFAPENPYDFCFPAHTPIAISPTETRPICEVCVGDMVLAFDPAAEFGRGALVPRQVVRLYRNTTEEWVKLTWDEGGEQKDLIATPGHHILDRFGNFPTIAEMLANGRATVVLASGELTEVIAERITYSAETAHLFEHAQSVGMISGNVALKTAAVEAWQTYNFEVEDLHTYVAGGVRVHNSSGELFNKISTAIDGELKENPNATFQQISVKLLEAVAADHSMLERPEDFVQFVRELLPSSMRAGQVNEANFNMMFRDALELANGQCFPSNTLVSLWDGSSKPISAVRIGDQVLSYDANGKQVPGEVTRLYRGETQEWVELQFDLLGETRVVTATPGHPFLTVFGTFAPVASLIDVDGSVEIVAAGGEVVRAKARLVQWSAETASAYEAAQALFAVGNSVLKPAVLDSWATYNFEVRGTHTYVAEGICVHNRCDSWSVNAQTLQAMKNAGLLGDGVHILPTEDGQFLVITDGGKHLTEGALKGQPFVVVMEAIRDYMRHAGDSVESVIEDIGSYLSGALPGLFTALVNGQDFEDAVEAYGAQIVAQMGVDTLARIFGLESLPRDANGEPIEPNLKDPLFFETEIGSAIKGALVSAAVMQILRGDELNSDDYRQLVLNSSVRFVVTQALQTQSWAIEHLGNTIPDELFDWFGHVGEAPALSPLGASAAAGAVSLLADLLDGGIEDLGQALGNAAVAAGTNYLSGVITRSLVGTLAPNATLTSGGVFAVAGPVAMIVGAVVGALLGKLFGGLFSPKPPMIVVERNADGTLTIQITPHSGGYIVSVQTGQDDDVIGSSGSDALIGSSGDNGLHGLGGADRIWGNAGDDLLTGGAGNDELLGGSGSDRLLGGSGADTHDGGAGNDVIVGGDGDDLMFGDTHNDAATVAHLQRSSVASLGNEADEGTDQSAPDSGNASPEGEDTASSTDSDDVLLGGSGNDQGFAGAGNDYVSGGFGDDILLGQNGDDVVMGDEHNDYISGGNGADVLEGDAGSDVLFGDADNDVIHGDKMVSARGGEVLTAIRTWLEQSVRSSNELKDMIGVERVYQDITGLTQAPFAGAFTLGEVLLTKISSVEAALIAQIEGDQDEIGAVFLNWLATHDAGLKTRIEAGNFAYLASDFVYAEDDPATSVDESATNPEQALFSIGSGDDWIDAGSGDDVAYGGLGNDFIKGQSGNDEIYGDGFSTTINVDGSAEVSSVGTGADTLYGGDGNDTIISGDGQNLVYGDEGNDQISTGNHADTVYGGAGADTINSGAGADLIYADESAVATGSSNLPLKFDVVNSGAGNDRVYGGNGQDNVSGGDGDDQLFGGEGNDRIHGDDQFDAASSGQDTLRGGNGDDTLTGGAGNDDLNGESGNDLASGGEGDDLVRGGDGNDTLLGEAGRDVLQGEYGNDVLIGGGDQDVLSGGGGDDSLVGGLGADSIHAGVGNDTIEGGEGADTLKGEDGNDVIHGDDPLSSAVGNDWIAAGAGSDSIYAGGGADTLDAGDGNDFAEGGSENDSIIGGLGNDTLMGDSGKDTLLAGDGDDLLDGGQDADSLDGGTGNDTLTGGDGNDVITAAAGNDHVTDTGGSDRVNLGDGDDSFTSSLTDTLGDTVSGEAGDDALTGGSGHDSLLGGDGHDRLIGGIGNDLLNAGAGNDVLDAGDGDDSLITGRGEQTLQGGNGNDESVRPSVYR